MTDKNRQKTKEIDEATREIYEDEKINNSQKLFNKNANINKNRNTQNYKVAKNMAKESVNALKLENSNNNDEKLLKNIYNKIEENKLEKIPRIYDDISKSRGRILRLIISILWWVFGAGIAVLGFCLITSNVTFAIAGIVGLLGCCYVGLQNYKSIPRCCPHCSRKYGKLVSVENLGKEEKNIMIEGKLLTATIIHTNSTYMCQKCKNEWSQHDVFVQISEYNKKPKIKE